MTELTAESLRQLADELDALYRFGAEIDEPEGQRYVKVSDTLLKQFSRILRKIADINANP